MLKLGYIERKEEKGKMEVQGGQSGLLPIFGPLSR